MGTTAIGTTVDAAIASRAWRSHRGSHRDPGLDNPSPNPNPNPNPNQVLDFLRNKRVPFEVVDFAATPEGRQRMAQISGDENSPLPQVQFERQSVSIDRLKDLEDHDELNPQLRRAVRRYAESVGAS